MSNKVSERTGTDVKSVAGVIAGGVYLGNKIKKGYDLAKAGYRIVGYATETGEVVTATVGAGESVAMGTMANVAGDALIAGGEMAGVDLMGTAATAGLMSGIGGALLPAIGVGLLAYELISLLWLYLDLFWKFIIIFLQIYKNIWIIKIINNHMSMSKKIIWLENINFHQQLNIIQ